MTIFALSTVEGQSGVAIIRVSGPLSKKALKRLTGKEPKPRLTTLTKIRTLDKKIIDEGVANCDCVKDVIVVKRGKDHPVVCPMVDGRDSWYHDLVAKFFLGAKVLG